MHKALTLTKKGFLTPHKYHAPRELPRSPKGLEEFLVKELGFLFIREEKQESEEEDSIGRGYHKEVLTHRVLRKDLKRDNRKGEHYEVKIRTLYSEEYPKKLPKGSIAFQQVIVRRSWEPFVEYTLCPRSTGWKKYGGKNLWARGHWGVPLLNMFNYMPLHLGDLKPDPIELKFELGEGLVLTSGTLSSEWAKAHIRHYLEDSSTLFEQVMARIDEDGIIEVQRLFDIV